VEWSTGAVQLLTRSAAIRPSVEPAAAGGGVVVRISGTNAPRHHRAGALPGPSRGWRSRRPAVVVPAVVPWLVSGPTADRLWAQAIACASSVLDRPRVGSPSNLGWSLATTRAALPHRAVVLGAEVETLADGLAAMESPAGGVSGVVGEGGLAFLFTGQGSQHPGMGLGWYRRSRCCAEAFDGGLPLRWIRGWSVHCEMCWPTGVGLEQTAWTPGGVVRGRGGGLHLSIVGSRPGTTCWSFRSVRSAAAHVAGVLSLPMRVCFVAERVA